LQFMFHERNSPKTSNSKTGPYWTWKQDKKNAAEDPEKIFTRDISMVRRKKMSIV